jgi:putative ABC transport system permease protein
MLNKFFIHEFLVPIKLAFYNLKVNLGRTILSLLGIVIGVTSVVVVLSLGAGVKAFVIEQVESFGTNFVEIEIKVPKTGKTSAQNVEGMVGGTRITTLKLEDAEAVSKILNIKDWYGGMMGQQIASYGNQDKQALIMGVTSGIETVDDQFILEEGRIFSEEESTDLKQMVVLGSGLKENFFGEKEAIGETIKIKKQSFKVVGVLEERGSTGFLDFDNLLYLPLQTFQKKILGVDYIQFALFRLEDKNQIDLTVSEMNSIMRDRHEIEDPENDDFAVTSIAEAIEMIDQVFWIVDALLLVIASISLIVGGVGIMNVMYVSVAERTFEIGLRKSLGAKNSDILRQFLFESVFLTLFGGILGIFLGFLGAKSAGWIMTYYNFPLDFPITVQAILVGVGFSAGIGVIFGLRPAYKASQLAPMEALRTNK